MADLYLIVGLGNPGRQYEKTRHNVGWRVLDELARRYNLRFDKNEKKALTASGTVKGRRVLLAKPQTYMNLSGEAVRGLVDFYKIPAEHILVISDDLDVPLGTLRLRASGSAGGQGGLKNIIQHLGTQDFNRVRFGIGRPPGKMQARDYVLQAFSGDDDILANEVADKAANAVEAWLAEGIVAAMSRYNGDIQEAQIKQKPKTHPEAELALYTRAHELTPKDPAPLEKMAGVLRGLGRVDEAAQRHLQAAALYEQANDPAKAISQRERAVSLKPEMTEAHYQIAQAYEDMGSTKKAVQRYVTLAEYLLSQGQHEDARQALDIALRLNPQHPKALAVDKTLREQLAE